MGSWGPGLYQDDIAEDVRDVYKDQLHRGKTGAEITEELLEEYSDCLSDPDDAPVFWFALADTQWNLGRLEDLVKEQALYHLREGADLRRWETEEPWGMKKRAKVLQKLEEKLLSPQPAEKKVSQYRLYHCEWKLGDVYAYPLESEYAKEKGLDGRYFLFHKIGERTYYPGHIIPVVRIKITKDKILPQNVSEFNALKYVQVSSRKCNDIFDPAQGDCFVEGKRIKKAEMKEFLDESGCLPEYLFKLINTSKRIIPKSLFYVGNFQDALPPEREFIPEHRVEIVGFLWKSFDRIMMDRYFYFNAE